MKRKRSTWRRSIAHWAVYRNYIHLQKEHSHGVSISADDARTLWEIAKSVARQVLKP